MKSEYTRKEIVEITGLKSYTIQFYIQEGMVVPEIDDSVGRGKVRRFSRKNLLEFVVLAKLHQHKVMLPAVRIMMRQLRKRDAFKSNSNIIAVFSDKGRMKKFTTVIMPAIGDHSKISAKLAKETSQSEYIVFLNLNKLFKDLD
jgi:DNA-binding transcriptional MerR regulator